MNEIAIYSWSLHTTPPGKSGRLSNHRHTIGAARSNQTQSLTAQHRWTNSKPRTPTTHSALSLDIANQIIAIIN